jgi:hypothetical protein
MVDTCLLQISISPRSGPAVYAVLTLTMEAAPTLGLRHGRREDALGVLFPEMMTAVR